jgi:hypothetical protein
MEDKPTIRSVIVACVVATYEADVPAMAVAEFCDRLRYPEWTREEVEQIGTRALNAVEAMNRPRFHFPQRGPCLDY